MHDVFSSIKSLLKLDTISVDNNVFRLHYKATLYVLVFCSLLITQKQYFGDPIDCIQDKLDAGIVDTYCWISSTFTVPSAGGEGEDVPHPGVAPVLDREVKHHHYYQWVALFLYLQALLFYFPRYMWKVFEGGKIKMLVSELNAPIVDDDTKEERKTMLVKYFRENLHTHNGYVIKFILCEVLNFVNIIGQIYFTNWFLDYEFTSYGSEVVAFSKQELGSRNDPMDFVFPKVAKCTVHTFGKSGTNEVTDSLCVLPLNILNEKIFVFLWFWYLMVAVLTGFGLVYRMVTLLPAVRNTMLRLRTRLSSSSSSIENVANRCQYGDWFLLYQLARNMDPLIFRDFIHDVDLKFKGIDD